MPEATQRVRCDQAIRPPGLDNCCTSDFDPCFKPAAHQHTPTGIALCPKHWENAETMGGPEAGEWRVGVRIIPFPEGWVEILQVEPASTPTPATLWTGPAKTVGGLIIEV